MVNGSDSSGMKPAKLQPRAFRKVPAVGVGCDGRLCVGTASSAVVRDLASGEDVALGVRGSLWATAAAVGFGPGFAGD